MERKTSGSLRKMTAKPFQFISVLFGPVDSDSSAKDEASVSIVRKDERVCRQNVGDIQCKVHGSFGRGFPICRS
jgi:hypothetical protein